MTERKKRAEEEGREMCACVRACVCGLKWNLSKPSCAVGWDQIEKPVSQTRINISLVGSEPAQIAMCYE